MQTALPISPDVEGRLKSFARELDFCLVGIAAATEADHFDDYLKWLDRGFHGEMGYLAKKAADRHHPRALLMGVKSVVVVALDDVVSRRPDDAFVLTRPSAFDSTLPPAEGSTCQGKVARFAHGHDYHLIVWRRLDRLQDWIRAEFPGCATRGVADTAPLLERDFARRAGLGWVGKNTMLINKRRGSYLMLGAVLTDTELKPDESHKADHCGTCTACLDACPTDAFPRPGVLDARKCISYLNIEVKGRLSDEQKSMVGDWLYGCDICQDVCPWNRKEVTETIAVDASELLTFSPEEFKSRFRGTVVWRIHRHGLARNAAIVLGNSGNRSALPALRSALDDSNESVRDAAAWAIRQIESRLST